MADAGESESSIIAMGFLLLGRTAQPPRAREPGQAQYRHQQTSGLRRRLESEITHKVRTGVSDRAYPPYLPNRFNGIHLISRIARAARDEYYKGLVLLRSVRAAGTAVPVQLQDAPDLSVCCHEQCDPASFPDSKQNGCNITGLGGIERTTF